MFSEANDLALEVQDLGKCYPIYSHPRDRLLQMLWGQRKRLFDPFWALQDVSFQLNRGRTLGIVGRNGSGKSTLLQLICGTLTPTTGVVRAHGRIGALLELGSGFNPEFSGLENVFLNASLLGLSRRQTEERLDAILAFADIGSFITQPVKTYSSGMAVRLAFAVQANVDPDILVVDEALAVGDEMFQKKCYSHLESLKQKGTSILLVTHSCPQILQHCDEALLIHGGRLRVHGSPKTVTTIYQRLCNVPPEHWEALLDGLGARDVQAEGVTAEATTVQEVAQQVSDQDPSLVPASFVSYESHGIRITRVEVINEKGHPISLLSRRQPFGLRFYYTAEQDFEGLLFACNVASHTGLRITGQQSSQAQSCVAGEHFRLTFHFHGGLLPGLYFVGGGIWRSDEPELFLHRLVDACTLRVTADSPPTSFGLCDLSAMAPLLERLP